MVLSAYFIAVFFLFKLRKKNKNLMKNKQTINLKKCQNTFFHYILSEPYSNIAEKDEKNGIKFVNLHKNHFQNWNEVV